MNNKGISINHKVTEGKAEGQKVIYTEDKAENKIQLPYDAVNSRGTGTSYGDKGAAGELPKVV